MKMRPWAFIPALLCTAAPTMASQPMGITVGTAVGEALGAVVGAELPVAVGNALPVGIGGVAAITALSLVVGIQLVKRKKR